MQIEYVKLAHTERSQDPGIAMLIPKSWDWELGPQPSGIAVDEWLRKTEPVC